MKIRTPFEGWTKQAFNERHNDDGAHCAIGYIGSRCGEFTREEIVACCHRVARYIRANYKLPRYYTHPIQGETLDMQTWRDSQGYDTAPLIYANNVLKITPERFKAIDEHMQVMEG